MTFLSIGFLLAGLAAAIPVLLHMIHRRALKELPFATLRFLKISEQKTRRKRRIQDILLLLLRVAVLLLIAIGLAHPTIRNLSNLWGGSQAAVVIVLDNSASMGEIDGDAVRLDTAVHCVERILDQLEEGHRIALIVTCGTPFPENGVLFTGQERIRQVLGQVKITYEKADLAASLHRARLTLSKENAPSKLIFVVSDQQKISWDGLANETKPDETGADAMRDIPVVLIGCVEAPKPNVGLTRLELVNSVPIAQVPVPIGLRMRNGSAISQKRRFEVIVDGVKQYASPEIELEPQGEAKHDFTVIFDRGGLHRGEVRLVGTDGSKYDDQLYFAMDVEQGIPVALIKPLRHEIAFLEETYYLERALTTGAGGVSPIRLSALSKEDLISEPISNYSVIIMADIPAPDDATAKKLADYVERGGNLIWTAGDNVIAEEYNAMNSRCEGKLLPCPILDSVTPPLSEGRDSWSIGHLDADFPAFRNLVQPPALYRSVLVYRHVPLDVSGNAIHAQVKLDDGAPLMAMKRSGAGSVTFLGTQAHVSWTNLPVRPIFVPLINQMIFQLSGIEQERLQTQAGSPLRMRFKPEEIPDAVEILPPGGGVVQLPLKKTGETGGETFQFTETRQTGIYTLRTIGQAATKTRSFSVNIDGDEIDPAVLSETEFKERIPGTPLVFSKTGAAVDSMFGNLKQGTSLWDYFLGCVLLILVAEAFVSNRLTQKKSEQQAGIDARKTVTSGR